MPWLTELGQNGDFANDEKTQKNCEIAKSKDNRSTLYS